MQNKTYKFYGIYTKDKWLVPGYIQTDSKNKVSYISSTPPTDEENFEIKKGYLLPGFVNAHSHAFQYAMAGLAESSGSIEDDNFWSWRNKMYQLVLSLTPESLFAITKQVYQKMIQNGYTNVVEFHYLHRQPDGKPYDKHDLSLAVLEAAKETGIQLTFAPVLYQKSYYNKAAESHQRRFIYKDIEDFMQYVEEFSSVVDDAGQHMAIAAHSMRSVEMESLRQILAYKKAPIHLHCAEQKNETNDFIEQFKTTPALWLQDNTSLNKNHNFVHCTHFSQKDLEVFAKNEANIVICPTTEANLGDGVFPLYEYHQLKGRWCFGTDSHVGISPTEELRWAEYAQRLVHQKRNLITCQQKETGEYIYDHTIKNGLAAAGIEGFLEIGNSFNGIFLKSHTPSGEGIAHEQFLSKIIFSDCYQDLLEATIIQGKWHHKK